MASKDRPERVAKERMEPKYHVYVRLPFNRGDFVDPPPVNWDDRKSEALWAIISGVSQTEINWNDLASRFEVTVEFLLQMASYLTERHTSQLRAQMRKVAAVKGSSAPSPTPGAEPSGFPTAELMRRTGSVGGRAPSALSMRKDTPLPRNEGNRSPTPSKLVRPQPSRTSSGGTAIPTQPPPTTTTTATINTRPPARLSDPHRRQLSIITLCSATPTPQEPEPDYPSPANNQSPRSPSPAPSSTSSSSSSSSDAIQSRIIRRPPRFQAGGAGGTGRLDNVDDDEDEDAQPAFLPYKPPQASASSASTGSSAQDLGATLRGNLGGGGAGGRRSVGRSHREKLLQQSQTSDSSTSSAAMVPRRSAGDRKQPPPGPLSPRRTAELAGNGGNKGKSREGSDGTPSMGSSFSDLDDASVTQSALEEALASRMQDGTIGSRMSTLGQAIRSRYLPGSNRQQ